MIRYIGLDVHRRSVRACATDQANETVFEQSLGCTRHELEAFAKTHLSTQDVLALESTFHSWAIVDVLAPYVRRVAVSNPQATKIIAHSKVKTDKVDARVISELLRLQYLPLGSLEASARAGPPLFRTWSGSKTASTGCSQRLSWKPQRATCSTRRAAPS
jgi:hypothetical protein